MSALGVVFVDCASLPLLFPPVVGKRGLTARAVRSRGPLSPLTVRVLLAVGVSHAERIAA